MAFTDLHELEEMFSRLAFAISPEDYDGYSIKESPEESKARTQKWRAERPKEYRRLLDEQSARAKAARGFQKLTDEEVRRRRAEYAKAYNKTERRKASLKASLASRYEKNPAAKEAALRSSREHKRRARAQRKALVKA